MIRTQHHLLTLALLLISQISFAQEPDSIPFTPDSIDLDYGIAVFNDFCPVLDGSKTRKINGRLCSGWIEDHYSGTEKLLHKGFYVNGKLTQFTNYYPNGQEERRLVSPNTYNAQMTVYWDNGQERSYRKILNGNPIHWIDYYSNGQLEYKEIYNKKFQYYLEQSGYQEDGTPEFELELTDKKHKIYYKTRYHDNGNKSEEGELYFYEAAGIYQRKGWWTVYDESGVAIRKEEHGNGVIIQRTTLD